MKRVSANTQMGRLNKKAIASDKTFLQLKDDVAQLKVDVAQLKVDVDILKHNCVEIFKILAKHDRILESHSKQLESHSRQLEDLNTKVDFLVEGVTEIIRQNRESQQLMQKIDPLAIEGEVLKTVVRDHISDRKVHLNLN